MTLLEILWDSPHNYLLPTSNMVVSMSNSEGDFLNSNPPLLHKRDFFLNDIRKLI